MDKDKIGIRIENINNKGHEEYKGIIEFLGKYIYDYLDLDNLQSESKPIAFYISKEVETSNTRYPNYKNIDIAINRIPINTYETVHIPPQEELKAFHKTKATLKERLSILFKGTL